MCGIYYWVDIKDLRILNYFILLDGLMLGRMMNNNQYNQYPQYPQYQQYQPNYYQNQGYRY